MAEFIRFAKRNPQEGFALVVIHGATATLTVYPYRTASDVIYNPQGQEMPTGSHRAQRRFGLFRQHFRLSPSGRR